MMASYYWIKLYHEILDDPKMGRLPDRTWRRVIELFLLAGDYDEEGRLPAITDIAWRLRIDEVELLDDMELLKQVGIVHQDNGYWIVTKFAERQAPVDAAERARRFRDRERKRRYYSDNASETEPERETNETFADIDIDTDTERDTEQEAGSNEPVATQPVTFQDWQAVLEQADGSQERYAVLRRMFETLYPGRKAPAYSRIGKAAKEAGGAGVLAFWLFKSSADPPKGDILAYCQAAAQKSRGNGRDGPPVRRDLDADMDAILHAMNANGKHWQPQFDDPFLQRVAESLDWFSLGGMYENAAKAEIKSAWFRAKGTP
jgi:hypothetical protein